MEAYVLNLAALAEIAGIPRTLAQNWTTGRPLRVMPSIAVAAGRGTQHLYSMEDAYVLALLYELKKNGLDTEGIAKAYDYMEDNFNDGTIGLVSGHCRGIAIEAKEGEIGVWATPSRKDRIEVFPPKWRSAAENGISASYHVVNLRNLMAAVNSRAAAYWKRRRATRRRLPNSPGNGGTKRNNR